MSNTAVVMDSGLLAEPIIGPATSGRTRGVAPEPLKFHLRRLADRLALFAEVEKLLRCEAEGGGEQGGRETLDARIVFLHGVIEEAARGRDLVFDVAQFGLQLLKVGIGLEVRIGLRQ